MDRELPLLANEALRRSRFRPAIEFGGRWISWGELRDVADRISELLGHSGVNDVGPVALIPRNRPSTIAALLCLISQSHNVQMIYGFQSPTGIARDIRRLKPAVLIAEAADFSEEVKTVLGELGIAGIAMGDISASGVPLFEKATARIGPVKRQIEIFTSGTTGPPKQFAIPYGMISRHHLNENRLPFLSDDEAIVYPPILLYFPLGNISGLYSMFPPLLKGQRAILLDRFSLEAWHSYVVQYRPVQSGIPPSFYQVLLDAGLPRDDLASIKVMGAGAAPLDPNLQREFEDRYGIPVLLSYGATEFGGPVTAVTLDDHAKYGRAKLGTVGRPISGATLRVVDPQTGAALPPDEEGLLEVISPRIGPDWIRTADIGIIDTDGFVFHRGRADGAIIRGGFKLLPETIENALKLHPGVSNAVVVGIPDRRLGEAPAAAVILRAGAVGVDKDTLDAHIRRNVPKTHVPTRWLFCEDFPRTISAKIDRQSVKQMFAETPCLERAHPLLK